MRRFETDRLQWCKVCGMETSHFILHLIDEDRELAECRTCAARDAQREREQAPDRD